MKKLIFILFLSLSISSNVTSQNDAFPEDKKANVAAVLKKYIDMGVPGLALSVYTPQTGLWSYAEGHANIEADQPLTTGHVHFLQSVSKTYMAVAILQLYEVGKVDLNAKIIDLLDYPWLKSIIGAEDITVKMLLNHTSGLPEYSTDPILVSRTIQDPLTVLTVPEMLSYIKGKSLNFTPGSKYEYRNTNYSLLSLIADKLTGNHVTYVNTEILGRLGLASTYYLTKDNYQTNINFVDSYWDILLEGLPTNISKMQRANVASMKGDDGMVATTDDAVLFIKGLIEGKLLKPETLQLMQEWVTDEKGEKKYGLGLTYYDLDITYGIGHSGGGIGAGCVLLYLPEMGAVVMIATNFNTMMESPIRKKAENLQIDILQALLSE